MANYVCMKCGQETNNPHFDLVSGVVRCPTCIEQEAGLLSKLRGNEENDVTDFPVQ